MDISNRCSQDLCSPMFQPSNSNAFVGAKEAGCKRCFGEKGHWLGVWDLEGYCSTCLRIVSERIFYFSRHS